MLLKNLFVNKTNAQNKQFINNIIWKVQLINNLLNSKIKK
jgi:hypothetical protein